MVPATQFRQDARKALLRPVLRRPAFQSAWSTLHRLSLWGMNANPDGSLIESGESWAMGWCAAQTPAHQPFALFDVGANAGEYTRHAIESLGARLNAHCFEPSPDTRQRLRASLGSFSNLTLLPFGLSDGARVCQLHSHPGGSRGASLVNRAMSHWGIEQSVTGTVELRRLNEYCKQAGIDSIDLLKLDVEGHETHTLEGAGDLLDGRRIRHIRFEFGAPDSEERVYFKDLYRMLSPRCQINRIYRGPFPIRAYSEFHQNFATTNFLAVAR